MILQQPQMVFKVPPPIVHPRRRSFVYLHRDTVTNKFLYPSIARPKFSIISLAINNPESSILTRSTSFKFSLLQEVEHLCQLGNLSKALLLFQRDLQTATSISSHTKQALGVLLQACIRSKDIEVARKIHELVSDEPLIRNDLIFNTHLITMYSACGCTDDSRSVFDNLPEKSLIQWNALVSGYTKNQLYTDAIKLFVEMISIMECTPDNFTLPCVIKASGGILDVRLGEAIHGIAVKMGLVCDVFVGNALIAMYGKCRNIEKAVKVFDKMPEKNLITWNSMICSLSENGYFHECLFTLIEMLVGKDSLIPDVATMVTVLPVCAGQGEIEMAMGLHSLAVKLKLSQELTVNNSLIDMYSKCGYLSEAQMLFDKDDNRNVVSWNSIIQGFSIEGDTYGTINLLRKMQAEGKDTKVNKVTILNVLPIYLNKSQLLNLKELYGYTLRHGLLKNELVANAFVSAFARCESLSLAEKVFNTIETKMVSSWNSIIGGFLQNGYPNTALSYYFEMTCSGLDPDWFSICNLLLACTDLKSLHYGRQLHGFGVRHGLEQDSYIRTSLMSLYNSSGKVSYSKLLFDEMRDKGTVSWNVMMSGYLENGLPNESLCLFRRMISDGIQPDEITILNLFGICSELSALRLGKEAHANAVRFLLTDDIYVGSSVIDMYAKCGCIEKSRILFDFSKDKNVVSWNAMINGYSIHGDGKEAMELFEKMKKLGLEMDRFTYMAILMACSHAGLIEKGVGYFSEINEPSLEHYGCVIDMLGRAGRLSDAVMLVNKMPMRADDRIWSSLLSCCRLYGDVELGKFVAEKLLKIKPDRAEYYKLLSNLYAGLGKWEDVTRVRKNLKENRLHNDVGCSWIELEGKVYRFCVGDSSSMDTEAEAEAEGRLL